jgi:hypothetical protein
MMAEASSGSTAANGEVDQASGLASNSSRATNKVAAQTAQLNKMRDANAKYKNLLKMAKERIQQQEEELEQLRRTLFVGCFDQLAQ